MMAIKHMRERSLTGRDPRGGFTLVEVLVTVLIFAVLAAAINTVLLVGESSWQVNSVHVELIQELRKAMSKIEDELRQTAPRAITDGPVDADAQPYDSITFYLPSGVSGNMITWNSDTTQYILGGTDSNVLQRIEGSETSVIAQNIQDINFTRFPSTVAEPNLPDIIEVYLQGQKNTKKGYPITVDFTFEVQMRN